MYDATTRDTYAQLFKLAEAKLPKTVRDATIKVASEHGHELVAGILKGLWEKP